MKIAGRAAPKRKPRQAPAHHPAAPAQRPQSHQQTLVARNNQMKSTPPAHTGKVHPFYSWDPLTASGPPSEIFATGASTYVPTVMRTQISTAISTKPAEVPAGVSTPTYYGYTVLVATSSKSGIACVALSLK